MTKRIGYAPLPAGILEEFNQTRFERNTDRLCHAPFRSLRFTYEGHAIVCCQNHGHSIGRYPDQSIKDIWFSKKADRLRDTILKNDLSSGCDSTGCESCAKMLTSRRYYHALARDFDYLPENKNRFPSLMELELSTTCNLGCIMCTPKLSSTIRKMQGISETPPMPYNNVFVDQLEEFIPHLHEIRFYGGEPFAIPIHYDIWEKIVQMNPNTLIFVQSNGTILTDRVKKLIERGRFLISLSIDSFVEKTYSSIRLQSDYKKVMENFWYFLDYCRRKDLTMTVVVCPMRQNWKEIPDIVKFLNDENIKLSFTTVLRPPECALWNLTSQELKEIAAYFKKFRYNSKNEQHRENLHYFNLLKEEIDIWYSDAKSREKNLKQFSNSKFIEQQKAQFIDRVCQFAGEKEKIKDLTQLKAKLENVFCHVENNATIISFLKKAENYPVENVF
ncbi:MAG: radical SAM protein, partial [Fidelibacterota bacterium]